MEGNEMTDEEINAVIAEFCGWTEIKMAIRGAVRGTRTTTLYGKPPGRRYVAPCPDYCSDLNAIAEAEKHLTEDQLEAMNTRIWAAMMNTDYIWQVTARQRAMALIEAVDYCPKDAK
jgi:hypothetical protein